MVLSICCRCYTTIGHNKCPSQIFLCAGRSCGKLGGLFIWFWQLCQLAYHVPNYLINGLDVPVNSEIWWDTQDCQCWKLPYSHVKIHTKLCIVGEVGTFFFFYFHGVHMIKQPFLFSYNTIVPRFSIGKSTLCGAVEGRTIDWVTTFYEMELLVQN